MSKKRLDALLVERGLVENQDLAQRLVMAGQVRVDGQIMRMPASAVPETALLEIELGPPFVSRGGEKLAAALRTFAFDPSGLVCADVGASTGGFTDCLLQNGAAKVYAIDVGKGILHWKLRQDQRVVVMEKTNARFVENLPEPIDLVTIDTSFISLKVLLPAVIEWLATSGQVIALVKPQFEAGRIQTSRGEGVIRDPAIHRQVLQEILQFALDQGFVLYGLAASPLHGPKGNLEFLAWLGFQANASNHPQIQDLEQAIQACLERTIPPK
jgi:23S rRNA (cytidine1920-2'-O)/16S rRNA (cytidine1409-2'-O)-methyltransferase